jgi:Tfp pilus assembly protein PilF
MIRQFKFNNFFVLLMIVAICAFVFSCAPEVRKPLSQLDTPEHHTYTGLKLLNQGKYQYAEREFELALQLDPKFSKAYVGLGLAKAYKRDFEKAFDLMKNGWSYAKTKDEKVFVHIGKIRLYSMSKENKDWLERAKEQFNYAIALDPKSSAAYYFMGLAYKVGLEFDLAGKMFSKVLDLNDSHVGEADNQWKLIQKIQRAMPGTITGKRIAIVESITRADVAALFMEELKIDVLYQKRTKKTFDTSFKYPGKLKAKKENKAVATDIAEHPLRADIEGILEIGVRGLENYPDDAFHPNDLITRANYAMMVEDILIKVTGEKDLVTKFIGSASPFPDLRSDLPYFNAVMVVTSRGIMQAKDFTTGEFAPLGSVSGVDALLVIRNMKEQLKFF